MERPQYTLDGFEEILDVDYPHLFEPLLEVVEIGGYLGIEEGNLRVEDTVFSISAWRQAAATTVQAPG